MVHSLKLFWTSESGETEIRRVTVNGTIINSYELMADKIIKLFPQLNGQCFQLGWKDSEGDHIVVSSDEELAQAVANAVDSNGLIKIFVTTKSSQSSDRKPRSSIVHPNVVCDGCSGNVSGYRYKCLECFDYDLCESCQTLDKHPGHDMLKICTPVGQTHNWMFPGWRRMYRSMFGRHPASGARCGSGKRGFAKHGEESDKKEKPESNPTSPHAEFLKNIGKSVAFFLDPLGIDVDVMVSESDTETSSSSNGSKKGAEAQTEGEEPKNMPEDKTGSEKDDTKQAADAPQAAKEEEAPVIAVLEKEDTPPESSAAGARPKNYGLFQRAAEYIPEAKTDPKESRECSPVSENFSGQDDWTVVNSVPNGKDDKNGIVVETVAGGDMKVSYPELPEEKMPSFTGAQKDEVPKDPKIANALSKMCAMGFTNEGGWLIRLLETKNGNINDVLDALYPNRH